MEEGVYYTESGGWIMKRDTIMRYKILGGNYIVTNPKISIIPKYIELLRELGPVSIEIKSKGREELKKISHELMLNYYNKSRYIPLKPYTSRSTYIRTFKDMKNAGTIVKITSGIKTLRLSEKMIETKGLGGDNVEEHNIRGS